MEGVHLFFLAFSTVFILLSDHIGAQYFLGKLQTVPPKKMHKLHMLVWTGLIGMIVSSALLMAPAWTYYIAETAMQIKLGFVLVLVVNGLFIGKLLQKATNTPFNQLPSTQRFWLMISGGASALGWIGAALIGFFWL